MRVERKLLSPLSLFETTRESPSGELESAPGNASLPHSSKKPISSVDIAPPHSTNK
jgi:hypothetical protein